MKAIFASYGTTGDVQPLLALALELRKRGHTVRFGAPPRFDGHVGRYGIDFFPLGQTRHADEYREVYGRASLTPDPVQQVQRTLAAAVRDGPRMVTELASACDGADVIITVPYQLAGGIVQELLRLPQVSIHLSPFGGCSRRFTEESSRLVNDFRASYGLDSVNDPLGPVGCPCLLSLCAVSPLVFLRPQRWPDHCHVTGFLYLDEEYEPDPELADFMASGEAPIVVTFGSMTHLSPNELAGTVADAIQQVGRRALIQPGWTGLQFESLPEPVRLVDFVPYQWLFPRAACVVHAGGSGTTAHTLRAGIPAVVVPHILDQFLWAEVLREQGCASAVVPFGQLTVARLVTAIQSALLPVERDRASTTARRLSRENGVDAAADLIESRIASAATVST